MSDGLKTGLILGGAGLVALLLYERSKQPAGTPSIPGGTLGAAPGATATATAAAAAAPSGSGSRSTLGTVAHYTYVAAVAPIVYPTKWVVAGAKDVWNAIF